MNHVLVLAYYSEAEAERYKVLARVLSGWSRPRGFEVSCLIATVTTGAAEDRELEALFASIMPTSSYRCQTAVTGYPARPTAMFWEILEYVAALDSGDGGFALWLEADMVPTRASWLAELHAAWTRASAPLIMGRYQSRSYVPASTAIMSTHINGGACYAKPYARAIPTKYKQGTFDHAPWPFLKRSRSYAPIDLFEFGTVAGLSREMQSHAVILHGYRQDKVAFYDTWFELVSGRAVTSPHPGPCCDLWRRHLGIEYCPIHSKRTAQVKLANGLSVLVATPLLSIRRRWRLLSKRLPSKAERG